MALFYVVLSLSLGTWMAFTIPPLQVPDEWSHLVRVDDTAEFRWKADMNDPSIGAIGALAEVFRAPLETRLPGAQAAAFQCRTSPACNQKLDPETASSVDTPTATIYSFVPYVAASIPWMIGRAIHAPAIETFYASRIANLISFTALTALAIFLTPAFRLMLATVALLPMTLQQAASVSADSLTLGLSFLFIGICIRFVAMEQQISMRAWLLTTLVALVLTLCKFNVFLLLLTLAIPGNRFAIPGSRIGSSVRKGVSIALLVLVSAVAAIGWQISNQENAAVFRETRDESNIPMQANVAFLREQPWQVPVMLLRDWERSIVGMAPLMVAGMGHFSVPAPPWLAPAALAILLAVSLFPDGRIRLRLSQRIVFASIFVATVVSLGALMFVFETPAPYLELARQGEGRIHGIQGRYYLPILPVLLVAFAIGTSTPRRWWRLTSPLLIAALVVAGNIAMIASARGTYHAYRPYGYLAGPHDGKLLRAAGPRSDGRVFVVARGTRHWVEDREWLERYGFRLEDTIEIAEAEMERIPEAGSVSIFGARRGETLDLPWETAASRYEGKVMRCRNGENAIYLVENGRKRHIQRLEWLMARKIADPDIVVISETEFQNLLPGEPVP